MDNGVTRRSFNALLASFALSGRGHASEAHSYRAISLDWATTETLLGLGHPPLAAAEVPSYNRIVGNPAIPPNVVDVGLRTAPNPEVMNSLACNIVLINPDQQYMAPALTSFGDVKVTAFYGVDGSPYRRLCDAAKSLAAIVGAPASSENLLKRAREVMAQNRDRLKIYDGRPLYVIGFVDGRHAGVATSQSLFQGVFDELGLHNAWEGDVGVWGIASVGLEALLANPDARLAYFTPKSVEVKRTINSNPLWLRLPFVQKRRAIELPSIWPFGALPSAMRFAQVLGDVLTRAEVSNG